ncbi:50S ribosomal protein L11 methyltransferase [Thermodesulfobacteriota bacterium]
MKNSPEHPGWLEISIDIDPVAHEAVSAFLIDLGCDGTVSESFHEYTQKAYLPFRKDPDEIRSIIDLFLHNLKNIFPEVKSFNLKTNKIENQDWSISWRRFFRPDRITQRLMVIPAWEPVPSSFTSYILRIDPGPAFGTGQHSTTRMCLQAMEKACLQDPWTMLDIGTGSGILAIYGAKLGAGRVVAIDIDPEAIRWAKRNIDLNDLPIKVELSSRPVAEWKESFSLLTANLILGTILDLCPCFSRILTDEGWLILSGILRDQVKEVEDRLSEYGLFVEQMLFHQEWACLIVRHSDKKGSSG